jgi:hypothetical protein
MTLGRWGLLLPALQLAVCGWIIYRIHWRRYPALLTYLVVEALSTTAVLLSGPAWVTTWVFSQPFRMAVRLSLVYEVFRLSCRPLARLIDRLKVAAGVIVFSVAGSGIVSVALGLSALQSFASFRQFFHLTLALMLAVLYLDVWRNPIGENHEHRYYRTIMTLNMIRIAIGAAFVKGGIGYMLTPYTMTTWKIVDTCSWLAAIALTAALGWMMTSTYSSLAPRRT